MPFQPEELYKHVKQLEHAYMALPTADANARVAVAKAIVSANASLVEGCLDDLIRFVLTEVGVPSPIVKWIGKRRKLQGLQDKMNFLKDVLSTLRAGWLIQDGQASRFAEGRMPDGKPGLVQLRNKVDHGEVVDQSDLRLNSIDSFRTNLCDYLKEVYASMKAPPTGWLGA
jgi:hypothetical protein